MHTPLIISFAIIFVAELVDKTLLVTLLLATRYPPIRVLLGAWAGFAVQTVIAVSAGMVFSHLPAGALRWASAAIFAAFGLVMLLKEEPPDDSAERGQGRGPFVIAFLAILVAEWGDATQVGTVALTARFHAPVRVFLGSLLGLWAGAAIAVILGRAIGKAVNPRWLRRAGGVVFLAIAVAAAIWGR